MNWRNLDQLSAMIRNGLPVVRGLRPDVIVGIPRSGMLAASMLALYLDLPLTDVQSITHRQGWRRNRSVPVTPDRMVLMDDSTNSGKAMRKSFEPLRALFPQSKLFRVAAIGKPWSIDDKNADLVFDVCDGPRVFEWNLWRNEKIASFVFDIDGVLCRDPRKDENDDGPRYEEFIRTVPPLYLPKRPIGWLATARLEKYRGLTEDWLRRHGVQYQQLYMLDLPSKAARLEAKPTVGFKSEVYRKTGARLFVESDHKKAHGIARESGLPVLAMDTRELIPPC